MGKFILICTGLILSFLWPQVAYACLPCPFSDVLNLSETILRSDLIIIGHPIELEDNLNPDFMSSSQPIPIPRSRLGLTEK